MLVMSVYLEIYASVYVELTNLETEPFHPDSSSEGPIGRSSDWVMGLTYRMPCFRLR
jgi:hypothetical protein